MGQLNLEEHQQGAPELQNVRFWTDPYHLLGVVSLATVLDLLS